MGCALLKVGESTATVCGGRAIKACIGCGHLATRLCDFLISRGPHRRTCDANICATCTTRLPGDKDACPAHAAACLAACRRAGIQLELLQAQ